MPAGDVELKGAEDRTYRLNFGTNAMCRLEDLDGRSYHEVLAELHTGKPRMKTLRAFMQAALVDPAQATADQVGTIIEDIGGAPVILAAFVKSDAALEAIGRQIDALILAGDRMMKDATESAEITVAVEG